MKVEKRDGLIEDFKFSKIALAVNKVFINKPICSEMPNGFLEDLKAHFESIVSEKDSDFIMQIEEIQNTIRDFLIKKNLSKEAEAFILYRKKREEAREGKSWLTKEIFKKIKGEKLENQNANCDEASFGGRIGQASNVVMKDFALKNLVSKMAKDNHNNNMIYIHDLDSYAVGMHNCLTIPFDKLLANGFTTRQTDVRPANSINTAMQLIAVIFQLQSLQQFGGVSASHLDWTMVPYVRKSFWKHYVEGAEFLEKEVLSILELKKHGLVTGTSISDPIYTENQQLYHYALKQTEKECLQSAEGLFHNLNTLQSRSGNQLPFTSINYGTCTLPEGRMVINSLLEIGIKGLGKNGRTSIFPCVIFQYMKGVNDVPGTPNYDLKLKAIECTSKRLYPNYANCDWSGNAGYDKNDPNTYFSTMGCRTANGLDINGLGQLKDGRGNICPVTIILPTIAMLAKKQVEKAKREFYSEDEYINTFIKLLDTKIHEAKDMLIERFNFIASQSPSSAKFMYENDLMAGYVPEEGIISALKHGTLSVGQIGVAEALQILVGFDHTTKRGMEYAKRIEQLYKDRCLEFKNKYKLNFGVYYTPAESLCYTSFNKWKDKYGEYPGVTYYIDEKGNKVEKEYFTNSIHVPVYKKLSAFEKLDIESELTGYSSAGCITYIELPHEIKHNTEALEKMVDYSMQKDIPYIGINFPLDTCEACGYQGKIDAECPKCVSTMISRLRRVSGYLTGDYKTAFNKGKQVEVEQRVVHKNAYEY